LFEVPTTYGVELRLVPTAMQVVSFGQAIDSSCEPEGIEVVVCQSEKSVVESDVAPPPDATPTATQVAEVEQDTEVKKLTAG
jgi:hypothetical protein